MGWVVILSPSTWRSSSGDAPTTSKEGVRTKNRYGLGLTRRSARYSAIPSSGAPVAASAGSGNDCRRASTTWIASPAAIASLATSTAWMWASRPRLVSIARPGGTGRAAVRAGPARGAVQLGRTWSRCAFERLVDRRLGDAVAAFQVRAIGVERGDRRDRVGQVVEHDHEVGFDERGRGRPDRVALRQRDGRLEDRNRVVGERPDAAAGEARHALGRRDAAARDELANRLERIGRRLRSRSRGRDGRPGRRAGASGCGRGRHAPRAGAAARCRGRSSGRAAPRLRPTRGGTPGRRRPGAGRHRSASRGRPAASRAAGSCPCSARGAWPRSG